MNGTIEKCIQCQRIILKKREFGFNDNCFAANIFEVICQHRLQMSSLIRSGFVNLWLLAFFFFKTLLLKRYAPGERVLKFGCMSLDKER